MFWLFWYGVLRASEIEFRSLRIWNSSAFPPESLEVLELVRGRGEGAAQVVGGPAGGGDVVVERVVGARGDVAGADVALGLQGVREVGRLLGQVGQVGHLGELLRVLHRGLDPQATEDQGDQDGQGEQGDQSGPDAPVAHREPAQTGGPPPGQGGPELVPGGLPFLAVVLRVAGGLGDHRLGRAAGGRRLLGGCHGLVRLRVTRAAATPFETSLHWRRNLWTGRPAASPRTGRCRVSFRSPAGPGERVAGVDFSLPTVRGIPAQPGNPNKGRQDTPRGATERVRDFTDCAVTGPEYRIFRTLAGYMPTRPEIEKSRGPSGMTVIGDMPENPVAAICRISAIRS